MVSKRFLVLSLMFFLLLLWGCGAPKVDPMSLQIMQSDTQQVSIPDICRPLYMSKARTVAVVKFKNNTTFGKMKSVNTQEQGQKNINRKHVEGGAIGAVATPGAVGIGYVGASKTNTKIKWSKDVNTFYRQISSKLGEYAQSAVEDQLSQLGGVEIYTRAQMQAIMQEQGFQMNVADPETLVQLGKIAGVEYIVTGTVDNINAKYVSKSKNNTDTGNLWANLAVAAVTAAANTQAGWNVTTEMTIQILDVATGKIILSKKVKGREIGGQQPGFNPELIVVAAKKAMGESVADLNPAVGDIFEAKAYINQLRGNKEVALISMGKNQKLQPGYKIEAYEFLVIKDVMSGEEKCTKAKIPAELTVSDQIDATSSWVKIEGDDNAKARIKIGTLVRRAPLKGQSVFKKMF